MRRVTRGIVLVVGQIARDLVLRIGRTPEDGGSAEVTERIERLGGKGANHAVGLHQLGAEVCLLGVVGEDPEGAEVLAQAGADGLETGHVQRRGTTALLVDVVEDGGVRRLFEHVPETALLTEDDVLTCPGILNSCDTVCLQLQQPAPALLAAAELARRAGARVVLDGAIEGDARDPLLAGADVLRADGHEAELLTGRDIRDAEDAERAAELLLGRGPSVVALGVPGRGDLVAWRGGSRFYPYPDVRVVDPTGGGDAFLAGLVSSLRSGLAPAEAGGLASRAAAATVSRLGGRPDLSALRS